MKWKKVKISNTVQSLGVLYTWAGLKMEEEEAEEETEIFIWKTMSPE